ncbi:primosomal protein N' [Elongatibacter sediminis]|uniref:Replication restart protein PriA n=1 Tax=Elongatibacter sediminis TaxID=3119006 RepID=A0AAW9RAL6_9GAMM
MSGPSPKTVLKLALPVPLPHLFDYLPPKTPAASESPVVPGVRAVVPFGRRKLVGVVVECGAPAAVDSKRLLRVSRILDDGVPVIDTSLLGLLRWCWQYYKHAPGEVLLAALPPALRKPDGLLPEPPLRFLITEAGREQLAGPPGRAPAQRAMLKALADGPLGEDELAATGSRWRAVLKRVSEQGWVESEPEPASTARPSGGHELTGEQASAVAAIREDLGQFRCHLLDGVTGSGKTEVYLKVLEQVLRDGGQGLVLVPEIGLTPQLLRRFRQRLGLEPAVLHSGLSAGERLAAWDAARTGRARLVIGTRSALFTPMPELGLIVLDEEHDTSFKQQDGFRYSARDVAVKRAADGELPVILGSATPSLESLNNAQSGRYRHHRLRHRANRAVLPAWRVLDMRQQANVQGLAAASVEAIEETLEQGGQAMVFLNRRGYAPVLMCQSCGWHSECARCDASLTWHRSTRQLCCHHCGSQRRAPELCPDCRADALFGLGEGTQQIEEALGRRFPGVPVLRFDRDSTARKGRFGEQVEKVMEGEPCILVGTQMLAKGHHFPGVTLVVVVNVDQALYSADFRALERLGQTLLQVAGRAGRMERPGTVMLQTFHPEHEALALLIGEGYEAYAGWLLEDRRAAGLPPCAFQALLRAEAHLKSDVETFLQAAAAVFPDGGCRVYGPLPALMERVGGRYRMYLMVQGPGRPELHRQLDAWLPLLRGLREGRRVRWAIDVDPQEV